MQPATPDIQQNLQLTDEQRHFLQKERRNSLMPLLLFVVLFSFCLFIVLGSLRQSFFIGALFMGVFMLVFLAAAGTILYSLWMLSLDLRHNITDRVEGLAQLSIRTEQGRTKTYYTHILELGKHYFVIPVWVYVQLKSGSSYRVFYAPHSKTFLYAEWDKPDRTGVEVIDRKPKPVAVKLASQLHEPLNLVDETVVKLKRDMRYGYRDVLYQRFRRDSLAALWIFGLLSLPVMCIGLILVYLSNQVSSNWIVLVVYAIPSGLILLALAHDYVQLLRDIRGGTLKTFEGKVYLSARFGRYHLNITDIQYGGQKHFTVPREICDELVDRQVYRVYYTPNSETFVYAEPL
ncbi:MAG: hypothetical protein U0694_02030 [Anaerolineae bacterium]